MQVEVAIIGQGIAGSTLALQLIQRGISFVVIDKGATSAATTVSSGLINPITGRKYVKSWMIDDLLPQSIKVYRAFEELLESTYINDRSIVRSIDTTEQENQWYVREADLGYQDYIVGDYDGPDYYPELNDARSFGVVHKSYNIDAAQLIQDFREYLLDNAQLIEQTINYDEIVFDKHNIRFGDIQCTYLICAEGWGVRHNPYFRDMPFRPAKGEVLMVRLNESFPTSHILKYHKFLVPQNEKHHFWLGSNYSWEFVDEHPTEEGRKELTNYLNTYLKTEYKVIDHLAGVRPATKYRKPLIGSHHQHKNLVLFNGLGTKGISLAPYWSNRLINHIYVQQELGTELPSLYK
jgi:glycine/D-amino acid oxidase-like deaminating enzyme